MFTTTNTANADITYEMNTKIRAITVDLKKHDCEGLFEYVAERANKDYNGRLATAIIELLKEHRYANTTHPVVVMQGNTKLAEL